MSNDKEGMPMKCNRVDCGYRWNYKGGRVYPAMVTCPQCHNVVRLPKKPVGADKA